jgi:hypothetical protein
MTVAHIGMQNKKKGKIRILNNINIIVCKHTSGANTHECGTHNSYVCKAQYMEKWDIKIRILLFTNIHQMSIRMSTDKNSICRAKCMKKLEVYKKNIIVFKHT